MALFRTNLGWSILLSLTILLTSCTAIKQTSTEQLPSPTTWQANQTALSQLQRWQINGKVAARTSSEAGSAALNWQQYQNHYHIALIGPLGTGTLTLNGQPGQVTLETPNGKTYHANSPEQLLAQQWGYQVPVSYLKYWVRGLPVPNLPHYTQFNQRGYLSTLIQPNWQITYEDYTRVAQFYLPTRIKLSSSALKVKIIISHWQLN